MVYKCAGDEIYEFQVDSTWDTTILVGDKRSSTMYAKGPKGPLRGRPARRFAQDNIRLITGREGAFRFRWGIRDKACAAWKPATCFIRF